MTKTVRITKYSTYKITRNFLVVFLYKRRTVTIKLYISFSTFFFQIHPSIHTSFSFHDLGNFQCTSKRFFSFTKYRFHVVFFFPIEWWASVPTGNPGSTPTICVKSHDTGLSARRLSLTMHYMHFITYLILKTHINTYISMAKLLQLKVHKSIN